MINNLITTLPSILYFLIILSIIVIVHEFGHLITAKRYGVYCYEFSIGLGPKLFSFYKDKSGTIYNLRLIPLGGYVQMAGEETSVDEKKDIELKDDQLLNNKKPSQRLVIYVAGVVMNFILAFVLLMIVSIFTPYNQPNDYFTVMPLSPFAEKTEFKEIYITSVDGKPINGYIEGLIEADKVTNGKTKSATVNVEIKDVKTNEVQKIEVTTDENNRFGLQNTFTEVTGIKSGFIRTSDMFSSTFKSLQMLFTGNVSVNDLSGPVGIYKVAEDSFKSGILGAFLFIAFISINIGIFNLLPIPALDGGRIIFTLIELIFRKKIPKKIEDNLIIITFILLLVLMVYVTGNDIFKLFK